MGRDARLWESVESGGPGGCRVYGWDGAWVSLGRFQRVERAMAPGGRSRVSGVVGRPTGGKAVLHGHDVTVGLAVGLGVLGLGDGRKVREVYRAVVEPLVSALNAVGVSAELGERTRFVGGGGGLVGDCFAAVSANDVVDPATGAKVCGCALRVGSRGVLVQASVPSGRPLVLASEVLAGGVDGVWREVAGGRTGLASALRESAHLSFGPGWWRGLSA